MLSRRGSEIGPQMFHPCAKVHVLLSIVDPRRCEKPNDLGSQAQPQPAAPSRAEDQRVDQDATIFMTSYPVI
jgi:hypothetical protein